jgi:uncharacterized protein (DUF1800 family)
LKSPFELVVSAVRALDAEPLVPPPVPEAAHVLLQEMLRYAMARIGRNAIAPEIQAYMSLVQSMELMGQVSYQCEAPTGFPDRSDYWLSAIGVLHRLRFAISLVDNQIPDMFVDVAKLEARVRGSTANTWERALATISGEANTRLVHIQRDRSATSTGFARNLTLLLGSPEFQHK